MDGYGMPGARASDWLIDGMVARQLGMTPKVFRRMVRFYAGKFAHVPHDGAYWHPDVLDVCRKLMGLKSDPTGPDLEAILGLEDRWHDR